MTPEMREFIDLLESQLGYSEKSGAYTKFGDWYGRTVEFDADYSSAPWCDMFLAWAATKLGYEDWMGQFAWTVAHAKWFKKQDAWGTKPEPGAFVFFDWGGSNSIGRIDHVGVVTKVVGGRIHTIEGNIDGGVAKRKIRDTDKVVGYGYPWKIKERLDAETAIEAKVGIGTLQDGPGLATLFPHVERTEEPKARDGKQPDKRAEEPVPTAEPTPSRKPEPTPSAEAAPAPVPGAAKSSTPKSGKHAKPSTADTSAVTTGPLPVITDAAPASQTSSIDSPALLTSALVAALAVLAVAKAKTLRLRPALAGAGAPAAAQRTPRSHRRRKGREPVRTPSSRPLQEPMELEAPRPPMLDGMEPVTALKSLRTPFVDRPIVIPEATSPFDAFSRPDRSAPPPEPEPLIKLVWDDDGSRCLLTDTGPIEIPREPGLYELPDPYSGFHLLGGASGPFPIREEPLVPAGAVQESPAGGAFDAPLRGRRHRQADVQRFEPFVPDAPLRGRRHRPAHDTAHRPAHEPSHRVPHEPSYRSAHELGHRASHESPHRSPYELTGRAHEASRHLAHQPEPARAYEPALARSAEHVAVDSRGTPGARRKPRRGRHRA